VVLKYLGDDGPFPTVETGFLYPCLFEIRWRWSFSHAKADCPKHSPHGARGTDSLRRFDGQNPPVKPLAAKLYPRSGYIRQNFDAVSEVRCPYENMGRFQ